MHGQRSSETTNAIEVEHLVKSYADFTAVCDLSFTVRPGEVFCLLGPNGAGKTTTTEILEGYRGRTSGHVSVLGFDPGRGERAFRERIGIVLQECGVQADLTVAEVLDMYGRYYPTRLATADVIELVELDAKATRPGRSAVRRSAPPTRPGPGPDRRPRGDLPRRADHRVRPGGPAPQLVDDSVRSADSARPCC